MRADNTISRISKIRDSANNIIVRELEIRGHKGLAPTHGEILSALLFSNEMTMTEIAEKINRDRSTVTALIKKLEKLGYIAVRTNDADSRSSIVSPSEKGMAMKVDFIEISEMLYERQYQSMTEEQIQAFKIGLDQVFKNFMNR